MSPDSTLVAHVAPSLNFNDRRGRDIDAIVLHYTGMATGEAALARLCDTASEVSAHYLVWEDGRIEQLVAEADRAWHAGRSFWRGETDMNAVSVGIEIVNGGHDGGCPPYPDAQVEAVIALCRDICRRRGIALHRVLGHSDIAPLRKEDPGEHFPWSRLAAAGAALALPVNDRLTRLYDTHRAGMLLDRVGYDPAATASDPPAVLRAFQRRWRPARVDGELDVETCHTLALVAEVVASAPVSGSDKAAGGKTYD